MDQLSFLDWLTIKESSQITGLSVRWIKQLCAEKRIQSALKGNLRFVNRASLLDYQNSPKGKPGRKKKVYRL